MAFSTRVLSFVIQLGQGSYGESGFNTVTVPPGLWATALIRKKGSPSYNEADIEIAGLPDSIMNQLSRVGLQPAAVRNNMISVLAGNDSFQLSTAFSGLIREAWQDFNDDGEAIMKFNAYTAMLHSVKPVPPLSYTGSTSAATIMGSLATTMGYSLENNGVNVQLSSPYFPGSARGQAIACAQQGGFYVYFENDNGVMAITPANKPRSSTPTPVLSPYPGTLIGYPKYVGPGKIRLDCEYNEQLRFLGSVVVKNSIIKGANGSWQIIGLSHDLSTRPDGPWFSHITGNNVFQ
jgi:hypothetical protein